MVAEAGHRVLLHGWNGDDPKVRAGLSRAGIATASTTDATARLLERDGIAYLPLETFHPSLHRLLMLRHVLGLRSCINTVCRMLNPGGAAASVQGVFHPSYRLLQADAAAQLGWQSLTVIKGGGGEFERHPGKEIAAFGLREAEPWEARFPALVHAPRRLADPQGNNPEPAWHAMAPDAFETAIVTGTAALAFDTIGVADSHARAETGWRAHGQSTAA
jgi:anthranilate phosphoribosyltransferase